MQLSVSEEGLGIKDQIGFVPAGKTQQLTAPNQGRTSLMLKEGEEKKKERENV